MTGDFNIRDNSWNLSFLYYFIHSNLLTDIANSMNLYIFKSTDHVLTRYSDNQEDSNLTIILFTQNGDFHLTILYLLSTLQYLINTFKPKNAQLSRTVKKRRTLLLN